MLQKFQVVSWHIWPPSLRRKLQVKYGWPGSLIPTKIMANRKPIRRNATFLTSKPPTCL